MSELPAGICQTSIDMDEYTQRMRGVEVIDIGPTYHRIIEIDATDMQLTALKNYMRAHNIHGMIRKVEEKSNVDERQD